MDEPLRDFAVLVPDGGAAEDLAAPCVFCEIVAGRQPASRIYVDNDVLAFLVLATVTVGHLVLIPKSHAKTLDDLTDEVGAHLFLRARLLARALRASGLPCEGIHLSLADGSAAGQQISHLHLQVVPRTLDDGYRVLGQRQLWTRDQLDATAATLRASLSDLRSGGGHIPPRSRVVG